MYDELTLDELAELTNMLSDAIYDVNHFGRVYGAARHALLCDLRTVEHEAWHTRCQQSGIRCLQDGLAA